MTKLWSSITTFNILYILNLWILDRTGNVVIKIFMIDNNIESVPIFGLTLGSSTTILSFYLLLVYARDHLTNEWHDRIPSLWIQIEPAFARKWSSVLIVLCIVFPLTAQYHFWSRFYTWQAWSNHEPTKGQLISLFEPVSPHAILDWDNYRYGNFSRTNEKNYKGLSYAPLYQPLIMLALTGGVIWFAIANALILNYKKIPDKAVSKSKCNTHDLE